MRTKTGFKSKPTLMGIPAPTDRPFIEAWHTSVLGFGVRIMRASVKSGAVARTYLARYRDADGKDVKKTLGAVDAIDYDAALAAATAVRSAAKAGSESLAARYQALPSLGDALSLYLAERTGTLAPTTIDDYKRRWNYLSDAHHRSVAELSPDWWSEQYARLFKIGGPTAQGTMRIAHAVYESLVADGKMAVNPVKRVAAKQEIYAHGNVRKEIIPRTALPQLWMWMHQSAHPAVRDWLLVAIFSGFRDAVIGNLTWENVDLENRLFLVLPEQRGNKAKVFVAVPIADELFQRVIEPRSRARREGDVWVIPSTKREGAPLRDVRGSLATFRNERGGPHIGPHIIRRTFATIAFQATRSTLTVGRMLTHKHGTGRHDGASAVSAGYITVEGDELREAFNATAKLIVQYADAGPNPAGQ